MGKKVQWRYEIRHLIDVASIPRCTPDLGFIFDDRESCAKHLLRINHSTVRINPIPVKSELVRGREWAKVSVLLAGTGIVQGLVVDQPISLLDLAPTMASILGVAQHPDWRGRILADRSQRKPLEMRSLPKKEPTSGRRREQLAA